MENNEKKQEFSENNISKRSNENYMYEAKHGPIEENIVELLNDFHTCSFHTMTRVFRNYNSKGLLYHLSRLEKNNYLVADNSFSLIMNVRNGKNLAHLCALDLMCIMNNGNFIEEYTKNIKYPFSYLFKDKFQNIILVLSLLEVTKNTDILFSAMKYLQPNVMENVVVLIVKYPHQGIPIDQVPYDYKFRIVNVYSDIAKVDLNGEEREFETKAYKMSPIFFLGYEDVLTKEIVEFIRKDGEIWEQVHSLTLK